MCRLGLTFDSVPSAVEGLGGGRPRKLLRGEVAGAGEPGAQGGRPGGGGGRPGRARRRGCWRVPGVPIEDLASYCPLDYAQGFPPQ